MANVDATEWRADLGLGTAATVDISAFDPAGAAATASAGTLTDPGSITVPTGATRIQHDQISLSGSEVLNLQGTAVLAVLNTTKAPPVVNYAGVPQQLRGSTDSIVVKDGCMLQVNSQLSLLGDSSISLLGSASLYVTDPVSVSGGVNSLGKG